MEDAQDKAMKGASIRDGRCYVKDEDADEDKIKVVKVTPELMEVDPQEDVLTKRQHPQAL